MPRIVSLWLPQWPVHRRLAAEQRERHAAERKRPPCAPVDPAYPFVVVEASETAPRIVAVNPAAAEAGLASGMHLADARARLGSLQVDQAEPAADAAALERLAHWATRYTPSVALFEGASGTDGLFLDITGAAHLLGGEENLLADLAARLAAAGLPTRLAVAETPGAAWALAHFARKTNPILPAGAECAALAPLPIEALRLDPATAVTLRRLGLKRVGALIGQHRAPFAVRFEKELLLRLDQALGHRPEPLALASPPPTYTASRTLLEPIDSEDAIVAVATRLMEDLAPRLEADGAGARVLRLTLYRMDGIAHEVPLGLALPTRSPEHVARLLRLRLERHARSLEAGFGFETLRLSVTVAEAMTPRQRTLTRSEEAERARRCTLLHDALRQRLGPRSVRHLAPVESHIPERSEMSCPKPQPTSSWPPLETAQPRPPLLLARPEPADVIALVPDGPPQRIRWRGALSAIAGAQGPERIAAEWWRDGADAPTRDYYLVEDATGRRLWLYREGIPGRETTAPRWFVHGVFP
ncbi:MAG TPA: DNA polymerase Y family protein [Hyphomicrobium sp.]|nr:DNA polymerase Y family protein [Hyphomicrobium sp.]